MKRLCAALTLAALAGCAGPKAPIPPEAAVQPADRWRGGTAPLGNVQADWWKSFNDDTLTRIVETALAHNDDIAIAATRVAQARAQLRYSEAQMRPSVTAQYSGGRERIINPGFGTPAEQAAGQGSVDISYDLDLFGQLASASSAARAALLASEAARDNVRLAVASAAAGGYFTLCGLDAKLVILRQTLDTRSEEVRIAKRRADTGYGTPLDLAQAEAAYHGTAQQIPATELAITREEDALSLLLGENPRRIERNGDFQALRIPDVPSAMPAQLLRRRPDIAAAEQRIVAADHTLDAARAAFMPDVRLAASGGFVSSTLITNSPLGVWAIGGSILAPIFSAGRLEAQQDEAVARRDEAAFAYRKTALTAFREVQDALQAELRDAEQEASLIAQRDALARALVFATRRYRAGYSPYLDQIDAQRGLLVVELAVVQLRADRLNDAVTLYQALGGGWPAEGAPDSAAQTATPKDSAKKLTEQALPQ